MSAAACDQTYLSRIENGQANPTLNAMDVIATGLGLSIFELFECVRLKVLACSGFSFARAFAPKPHAPDPVALPCVDVLQHLGF